MYRQTGFAAGAEPPPPGPAEVPGSPGVPGFGGVVTLIVQPLADPNPAATTPLEPVAAPASKP